MNTKNIVRVVSGTVLILLIPLIAMQFSDDVDWKLSDFVVIGTLLLAAGFTFLISASKVNTRKQKTVVGVLVITAVLLAWAELAVGLFGTPFAGS